MSRNGRLFWASWRRFLCIAAVLLSAQAAHAQAPHPAPSASQSAGPIGDRVNANTLAIMSSSISSAWLTIAYDLSAVLDDGDNLRILPVVGKGGAQNIRDVRFLRGVDLGITITSVLEYYRRNGELGKIDDKIVYIAKLFNDEMHLLVHASSGITSIEQLRGKKINFSDAGSSTQISARIVFDSLGIAVQEVNMAQVDAQEKLKTGEVAATVQFGGKPQPGMLKLPASAGFRLLSVPYPKALQQDFLPATLTHEDYPGLVDAGKGVDTIAYTAVIICYNWPKGSDRYRRIEKFVDAFFSKLPELQKPPRHPKWQEVNLMTVLPGLKRFAAAEEWLQRYREQQQGVSQLPPAARVQFDQFSAQQAAANPAGNGGADRDRIFQDFLKWRQERGRR
jgi:uncharacterized protein